MIHNPAYESMGPAEGYRTGVHESAHWATDRQARRGRSRSPYRLATILNDPTKIAREEGRADATMRLATGVKSRSGKTGYESGLLFDRAGQAEYDRVRANMGAPNQWARPGRSKTPHRGVRVGGARALGRAVAAGTGLAGAGTLGYLAWDSRRQKRIMAKSYTVHQRSVNDLEARFESQRTLRNAARTGASSLASGDYQNFPHSAWRKSKAKGQVTRRAYAQRNDPRFFDLVSYAQTSDPKARLSVRERSNDQLAAQRAGNAAQGAALAGGAGLALGMRHAGTDAKKMIEHATQGNWRGLLPGPKARRLGAMAGLAGATVGAALRPSPVDVRYRSAK